MRRTSERLDDLMAALAAARPQFPAIRRNKTVTVRRRDGSTYTFTYGTLDTILDAVCPVLGAHGLALVCGVAAEDGVVRVTTRLAHASGQWVETALAVPQPATLQELGSAVTYLKRYAINALLAIEGETDDDGNLADDNTIVASGEREPADPVSSPANDDEPPLLTIPTDVELPCGGQWAALLVALQAERAARVARGQRRRPPTTASTAPSDADGEAPTSRP
jgi:hypothetical protein